MGSREREEQRRRAATELARPSRNESTVIDDDIRSQLDLDADATHATLGGEPALTTISAHDFSEFSSPLTDPGTADLKLGGAESPPGDFADLESGDLSGNRSRTVAYSLADSTASPPVPADDAPLEELSEAERTVFDAPAHPGPVGSDPDSVDLVPSVAPAPRSARAVPIVEVYRASARPAAEEPSSEAKGADVIPLFRDAPGSRAAREPESRDGRGPVRGAREAGAKPAARAKRLEVGAAGQPKARPRGDTLFDHLPRWLLFTDSAAKTLPIIIAIFVGLATLAVGGTLLLRFRSGEQHHVELTFLESAAAKPTPERRPVLTPLTIETEPPGVLVVLDRKILGATPVTVDVAIASDQVGLQLSGPYFEPFIGHATRGATGAYSLKARLLKRR